MKVEFSLNDVVNQCTINLLTTQKIQPWKNLRFIMNYLENMHHFSYLQKQNR